MTSSYEATITTGVFHIREYNRYSRRRKKKILVEMYNLGFDIVSMVGSGFVCSGLTVVLVQVSDWD